MRKFIRDPNTSVNQDMSGSAGRHTGDTPLPIPGSVGQNMQHSYNKRQIGATRLLDPPWMQLKPRQLMTTR